jgi:cytochrome c biogenesis protein CcdA/thiol-disulfide isomerase/thioredoxin
VLLLLLFALLAGAGTAITPCVLPVVPALLAASGAGGRRRPLGIVLGLGITFTIAIDVLTQAERAVGLTGSAARDVAIVVLIAFGVVLLIPELAQRIQAPMSRLARFGPKTRGDGFLTGLAVGGALGFVCAPCAGPILAGVISVANSSGGATFDSTLTAVAYSVGLCLVMLIYAYGGRWALAKIKGAAKGYRVERALGVVLLITGIALVFNVDTKLTNLISKHENSLPGVFVDPTRGLEASKTGQKALGTLTPKRTSKYAEAEKTAKDPDAGTTIPAYVSLQGVTTPALKSLGKAPDFTNTQDWFNTPGDKPLSIASLKGKVVLVDFWTYTCINCVRTLPFIEGLYKTYHKYGLEVVGVETPEFSFEQEASNVQQAIKTDGLTYPVVQDNDYGTWDAYHNEYWPADYLIDANGEIRHTQFGEGAYEKEEAAVRTLLYEAGHHTLPKPTTAKAEVPSKDIGTEETYLNSARDEGFAQPIQSGTHTYRAKVSNIQINEWALNGSWTAQQPASANDEGSITPAGNGASITGGVEAKDVYLVMTSENKQPLTGRVLLDGEPIPAKYAGTAVRSGGYFTVTSQTLYNLVKLPQDGQFAITVELPKGISAYDFTFG